MDTVSDPSGKGNKPSTSATEPIDFSECEREPIHAPPAIQRHGAMLVIDAEGSVLAASRSCTRLLSLSPEDAIGKQWGELPFASELAGDTIPEGPDFNHQSLHWKSLELDVYSHHYGDRTFWEFECCDDEAAPTGPPEHQAWDDFRQGDEPENFFRASQLAAEAYRELTGYDRVMVYRFHPDWTGEVIAEVRHQEALPFLGLRYPATDIPSQARALFLLNPTRVIVDVEAFESKLILREGEGPIDCSCTRLRGTSPYHLEYLRNMGVRASLVQALRVDGELWGLIVGHHNSPRLPAPSQRDAGETIAAQLSKFIERAQETENARYDEKSRKLAERLREFYKEATPGDVIKDLLIGERSLPRLLFSNGALFVFNEDCYAGVGHCPNETQLARLLEALKGLAPGELRESSSLLKEFGIESELAGLLAGRLRLADGDLFIMVFRKETRKEVFWGGDPSTPAIVARGQRMAPRKSFDLWRENVRAESRPWGTRELSAFKSLLEALAPWSQSLNVDGAAASVDELRSLELGHGHLEELMLGASRDGLALIAEEVGDATPKILQANPGMFEILNFEPDEVERESIHKSLLKAGVDPKIFQQAEAEFDCWVPKNGHRVFRTERRPALTMRSPQGQRSLSVVQLQDVTMHDRMMEAMTVARDQARRAGEAQAGIFRNMSHETRTPLNAIVGFSDILLEDQVAPDAAREMIREIQNAGNHLLSLLNDMLEISQGELGKFEIKVDASVDLVQLSRECVSWLGDAAKQKSIELKAPVSSVQGAVLAQVDRQRIRQVFLNLLGNAIKYSPPNTTVHTEFRMNPRVGLEILFRDQGIGMDETELKSIFEPFVRLENPEAGYVEGFGLGLSISKAIIETHGGRIRVSSERQKGTSFILEIPVSRLVNPN